MRHVLLAKLTRRKPEALRYVHMSKIYFFRHAQASYLADNYDKLSEKGELQSAELGKYLVEKKLQFDKIFVGPLERQKHTFEIVSDIFTQKNISFPAPVSVQQLKEHSGTEAVKLAYPQLMRNEQVQKWQQEIEANPKLMKRNTLLIFQYFMDEWAAGNIEIEGIESWHEFRLTVKKGLNTILQNTGKGETIGVFTSGGTIASITAEALNIADETRVSAMNFSIRNTSFSSFLFSKNNFNLLSFNELPHLANDMITFV